MVGTIRVLNVNGFGGSAAGGGVVVTFIHGFRSSAKVWVPCMQALKDDNRFSSLVLKPFEYETGALRWNLTRKLPSLESAAEQLDSSLRRDVDPNSPVVLVTHSQGGLVAQKYIARCLEDGRGGELRRLIRVIMFACPNDGSDFLLSVRRRLLGRHHPQEKHLRPLDEMIGHTKRVVISRAVYAPKVTESMCPVNFVAIAGTEDKIVKPSSAEGVFPNAYRIPGDHSSIIPRESTGESYRYLAKELQEALSHPFVSGARRGNDTQQPSSDRPPLLAFVNAVGSPGKQPRWTPSPTRFVGRSSEVEAITVTLRSASPHEAGKLVVIQGEAGSGKTTLALHVAAGLEGTFTDGVIYIDLLDAPSTNGPGSEAIDLLLSALGAIPEVVAEHRSTRQELLTRLIADKRILLILENAADAGSLEPLLIRAPGCATLVTSGTRLEVQSADLTVTLNPLDVEQVVEVLRSSREGEGPAPAAWASPEMTEIVRLVGGLPVALRPLGALLGGDSAGNVSTLLESLRRIRATEDASDSSGHTAAEPVLRLGYQSLSDNTRLLLTVISLLPLNEFGDWLLDDAVEVNPGTDVKKELQDAGLLLPSAAGRVRIHGLVSQIARQEAAKFPDQNVLETKRQRMIDMFATRAGYARRILEPERPPMGGTSAPPGGTSTPEQIADAEEWLEHEHANLVSLMDTAAKSGYRQPLYAMANSLPTYFIIRGTWNDWRQGLEHASRLAKDDGEGTVLGYCLQALANIERTEGRSTGRSLVQMSVKAFQEAGDREGEAYALNDLGLVQKYDAEIGPAISNLIRSEETLLTLGNGRLALHPARNRGLALLEDGQLSRASYVLRKTAMEFLRFGDWRWGAFTLADLGIAYRRTQQFQCAQSCLQEAITLLDRLGEHRWRAVTQLRLGDVQREMHEGSTAQATYRRAMVTFEELVDPLWVARAQLCLALTLDADGGAISLLNSAQSTFRRLGSSIDECKVQLRFGQLRRTTSPVDADLAMMEAKRLARLSGRSEDDIQTILLDLGVGDR